MNILVIFRYIGQYKIQNIQNWIKTIKWLAYHVQIRKYKYGEETPLLVIILETLKQSQLIIKETDILWLAFYKF